MLGGFCFDDKSSSSSFNFIFNAFWFPEMVKHWEFAQSL